VLRYKDSEIEAEFWHDSVSPALRHVFIWLAEFCHVNFGKDVIVTDILRPANPDKPSAHTTGHGGDFKANNGYWAEYERREIVKEFTSRFGRADGKKVIFFHSGIAPDGSLIADVNDPNYHGHIQIQQGAQVIYFTKQPEGINAS